VRAESGAACRPDTTPRRAHGAREAACQAEPGRFTRPATGAGLVAVQIRNA